MSTRGIRIDRRWLAANLVARAFGAESPSCRCAAGRPVDCRIEPWRVDMVSSVQSLPHASNCEPPCRAPLDPSPWPPSTQGSRSRSPPRGTAGSPFPQRFSPREVGPLMTRSVNRALGSRTMPLGFDRSWPRSRCAKIRRSARPYPPWRRGTTNWRRRPPPAEFAHVAHVADGMQPANRQLQRSRGM